MKVQIVTSFKRFLPRGRQVISARCVSSMARGIGQHPSLPHLSVRHRCVERWCQGVTLPTITRRKNAFSKLSEGLCEELASGAERRFVFVGGKGGVGKTTTAASLAVRLAKSGLKTLVVSTDPAHSLGDALGMELSGGGLKAVALPKDFSNAGPLYAMEIDPGKVVEDFRQALSLDRLREALREKRGGIGAGLMSALSQAGIDLESLATLLELSPPGIDEVVALAQLMKILENGDHSDFQRVIIDTAPTGHTLRLLSFPQFLHGVIGTILSINEKVSNMTVVGGLLGRMMGDDLQNQLQVSKKNLEATMSAMGSLSAVFKDATKTNFIVVTIPTHLAVSESRRLLKALAEANMPARHLIVNKCPISLEGPFSMLSAHTAAEKLTRKDSESGRSELGISNEEALALLNAMNQLLYQYRDAQKQVSILQEEVGSEKEVYLVPVFDEELTGPAALDRYAEKLKHS